MLIGLNLACALNEIVNGHGGQAVQAAAPGGFLGNALEAAKLALQILVSATKRPPSSGMKRPRA